MANSASVTPASNATPATPAPTAAKPGEVVKTPVAVTPKPGEVAKTPAPTAEELFEVQIDGKVEKKSRKEIIEAYQLRQLSDKKRSEADRVLAEYQKVQALAKQDPIKFMKAMGYDFDGIATSYLAKKAEDSMKDPKVLEAEQLRAENEQYKQWVEEQKKASEQQKKSSEINAARQQIHQEIIQAVEEAKDMGLPVDEELIIAVAQQMMVQDKAKKPLNAKEALPATYAKTQKWLQGLANKMEGEALVKWLGDDVAKKIRKYDLTQLKAKRTQVAPATGSLVKPNKEVKQTSAKPYKTWSQFKSETLDNIK